MPFLRLLQRLWQLGAAAGGAQGDARPRCAGIRRRRAGAGAHH